MEIIDAQKFNEIKGSGKLVVDFFADWCGPCKSLGPILEELSTDYPEVTFVKVNVDESQQLAREFGVMSIPYVFMLEDGEIKNRFLGFQDKESVKKELDKAFPA